MACAAAFWTRVVEEGHRAGRGHQASDVRETGVRAAARAVAHQVAVVQANVAARALGDVGRAEGDRGRLS